MSYDSSVYVLAKIRYDSLFGSEQVFIGKLVNEDNKYEEGAKIQWLNGYVFDATNVEYERNLTCWQWHCAPFAWHSATVRTLLSVDEKLDLHAYHRDIEDKHDKFIVAYLPITPYELNNIKNAIDDCIRSPGHFQIFWKNCRSFFPRVLKKANIEIPTLQTYQSQPFLLRRCLGRRNTNNHNSLKIKKFAMMGAIRLCLKKETSSFWSRKRTILVTHRPLINALQNGYKSLSSICIEKQDFDFNTVNDALDEKYTRLVMNIDNLTSNLTQPHPGQQNGVSNICSCILWIFVMLLKCICIHLLYKQKEYVQTTLAFYRPIFSNTESKIQMQKEMKRIAMSNKI